MFSQSHPEQDKDAIIKQLQMENQNLKKDYERVVKANTELFQHSNQVFLANQRLTSTPEMERIKNLTNANIQLISQLNELSDAHQSYVNNYNQLIEQKNQATALLSVKLIKTECQLHTTKQTNTQLQNEAKSHAQNIERALTSLKEVKKKLKGSLEVNKNLRIELKKHKETSSNTNRLDILNETQAELADTKKQLMTQKKTISTLEKEIQNRKVIMDAQRQEIERLEQQLRNQSAISPASNPSEPPTPVVINKSARRSRKRPAPVAATVASQLASVALFSPRSPSVLTPNMSTPTLPNSPTPEMMLPDISAPEITEDFDPDTFFSFH